MSSMMRRIDRGMCPDRYQHEASRPLIIGIIPHTMCNPQVRGCGYCTFPHHAYRAPLVASTAAAVRAEITASVARVPSLRQRAVPAVYLGGGTANLGPAEHLQSILTTLAASYDLSNAEVTLEGVPAYFSINNEAMLRMLQGVSCRQHRVSMGVQTFDATWLSRMGRTHFGDQSVVATVRRRAVEMDFTTSCDLLYNLPGASDQVAQDDVARAIDMGFDQICIYNLVLGRGIPSAWAGDAGMIAAMRSNDEACRAWISLRDTLLQHGYVQQTLTNFERADVAGTPRGFAYEKLSFKPLDVDGIGYGPGAISTIIGHRHQTVKWSNTAELEGEQSYASQIQECGHAALSSFDYDSMDLVLLALTRGLATASVRPRSIYATVNNMRIQYGLHALDAQGTHACLAVLEQERLLVRDGEDDVLTLTPRGMFYADSVVGFLSHQQMSRMTPRFYDTHATWSSLKDTGNSHGHM